MPKEEWGVKRLCPACQTRFYDLQNDPMTCPNCGAQHTVESLASGKTRTMTADKADAKGIPAEADTDEDEVETVVEDDDDDAADVDLGDDVLEDDEDDEDTVPLEELADVSSDDSDDT